MTELIIMGVLILLAVAVLVLMIVFFTRSVKRKRMRGKLRKREILAPVLAIILWTLLAAPYVWFGIEMIGERIERGGL